jgi:hypothetical protein
MEASTTASGDGEAAATAVVAKWRMPDEVVDYIVAQRIQREEDFIKIQRGLLQGKTVKDVYMSIVVDAAERFESLKGFDIKDLYDKI